MKKLQTFLRLACEPISVNRYFLFSLLFVLQDKNLFLRIWFTNSFPVPVTIDYAHKKKMGKLAKK